MEYYPNWTEEITAVKRSPDCLLQVENQVQSQELYRNWRSPYWGFLWLLGDHLFFCLQFV